MSVTIWPSWRNFVGREFGDSLACGSRRALRGKCFSGPWWWPWRRRRRRRREWWLWDLGVVSEVFSWNGAKWQQQSGFLVTGTSRGRRDPSPNEIVFKVRIDRAANQPTNSKHRPTDRPTQERRTIDLTVSRRTNNQRSVALAIGGSHLFCIEELGTKRAASEQASYMVRWLSEWPPSRRIAWVAVDPEGRTGECLLDHWLFGWSSNGWMDKRMDAGPIGSRKRREHLIRRNMGQSQDIWSKIRSKHSNQQTTDSNA